MCKTSLVYRVCQTSGNADLKQPRNPKNTTNKVFRDFPLCTTRLVNSAAEASASEVDMYDQLSCVLGCCVNQEPMQLLSLQWHQGLGPADHGRMEGVPV